MRLVAEPIDIGTKRPVVLLNGADAETLGVNPLDRVKLRWDDTTDVGIVKVTDELVDAGRLGVSHGLRKRHGEVAVAPAPQPESVSAIRRKLDDAELDGEELRTIVDDIHHDRLSDMELSAYVCGSYTNELSLSETTTLTQAMADVGERLHWDAPVVADKHSIGGVAGNRVTPILVSIAVAAGLPVPKTSSRAVTSPAGTADTMAVFCPVEFDRDAIDRIVTEAGGCLVWGGAVDLSPVDDKVIRAQTPLSLDPHGQLIASVLSKKVSAGTSHLVIDLPYGEGAKVTSLDEARELAEDLTHVADGLDISVECAITRGSRPVGTGIGPVLEARDVLAVLEGDGPEDLRRKSVRLADLLLEMTGPDAFDGAPPDAETLLDDGDAAAAFRDIVAAQGGDRSVTVDDFHPGDRTHTVTAADSGVVDTIANDRVSRLARRAGAPSDPGAGLHIHRHVGDEVSAGDRLYTIHAERQSTLDEAIDYADEHTVVRVSDPNEALVERV